MLLAKEDNARFDRTSHKSSCEPPDKVALAGAAELAAEGIQGIGYDAGEIRL